MYDGRRRRSSSVHYLPFLDTESKSTFQASLFVPLQAFQTRHSAVMTEQTLGFFFPLTHSISLISHSQDSSQDPSTLPLWTKTGAGRGRGPADCAACCCGHPRLPLPAPASAARLLPPLFFHHHHHNLGAAQVEEEQAWQGGGGPPRARSEQQHRHRALPSSSKALLLVGAVLRRSSKKASITDRIHDRREGGPPRSNLGMCHTGFLVRPPPHSLRRAAPLRCRHPFSSASPCHCCILSSFFPLSPLPSAPRISSLFLHLPTHTSSSGRAAVCEPALPLRSPPPAHVPQWKEFGFHELGS
jgi:hypothetical protein